MALRLDTETAGRCLLAAFGIIDRELSGLDIEPGRGRRLGAAIAMAREHVAEILDDDDTGFGSADGRRAGPRPATPAGGARRSLAEDAAAAWAAAAALRQAATAEAAAAACAELRRIATGTEHDRVRRLCDAALGQ